MNMPFQPGNQEAKKANREKPFAAMLRLAINEAHEKGGNRLRAVADALVDEAIKGNVAAAKEIADRLDGKVPQAMQHEGGENPIRHEGRIELVAVRPDGISD